MHVLLLSSYMYPIFAWFEFKKKNYNSTCRWILFVTFIFKTFIRWYEFYVKMANYMQKKKRWIFISLHLLISIYLCSAPILILKFCWMYTGNNFNQSTWMKMMSLNNDFLYYKLCSFLMLSNFYLFVIIPNDVRFVCVYVCMFVVVFVR